MRKPGTIEELGYPRDAVHDLQLRDTIWTMTIEAMDEREWNMDYVVARRKTFDLASIVDRRLASLGIPVYTFSTTASYRPPGEGELNLDGSYRRPEEYTVHHNLEGPRRVATLRATIVAFARGYPRLDPRRPETIPTFLHPHRGDSRKAAEAAFRLPQFDATRLPAWQRALVPLTWVVAWFSSLRTAGKFTVVVVVLIVLFVVTS